MVSRFPHSAFFSSFWHLSASSFHFEPTGMFTFQDWWMSTAANRSTMPRQLAEPAGRPVSDGESARRSGGVSAGRPDFDGYQLLVEVACLLGDGLALSLPSKPQCEGCR